MMNMKPSGVEWIGDIPVEWEARRLKYILHERKEKNDPLKTDNILSLSAAQGVIRYSERQGGGNKPKEDLTAYKVVHKGDIVLNSMNVLSGAVNYSNYTGCVSPVYYMLYSDNDIVTRYYNLLFQTEAFQKSLRGLGNGILIKETDEGKLNTIRMRIPMEKLGNVLLPMPTYADMEAIVNSIEPLCLDIDEIIAEATASIEEYKELKQAVIFEAVTKGLDKNVPMKDSGVEWIGETPDNWTVLSLRFLCEMQAGKNLVSEEIADSGDYPVYGGNGLRGYYSEYNTEGPHLLVGRQGALCGNVHSVDGQYWCTEHAVVTTPSSLVSLDYLYFLLVAMDLNQYASNTAAQPGLSVNKIIHVKTVIPEIKEQNDILEYLEKKIPSMDALISEKQALIDDLQAYKKSLIYEVVTGKRRVV